MSREEPLDELDAAVWLLRVHDAPPERVARLRSRCLAAMEVNRRRSRTRSRRLTAAALRLEPLAALAVSALYLAAAVQASLALVFARW